jgi:DNA-binding NarL/FixJ family response regulator
MRRSPAHFTLKQARNLPNHTNNDTKGGQMTDTPPKGRALIVARMSAQGWTVRKISAEAQVSETTVTRTRRRHRDWITAARDD